MPEKADDAAGLTPSKEDNAFWCNLDRKELKILIRFYCESSAFTVKFHTNASTSPLTGQPVLMHKNSHAPMLSYIVARLKSAWEFSITPLGVLGIVL